MTLRRGLSKIAVLGVAKSHKLNSPAQVQKNFMRADARKRVKG